MQKWILFFLISLILSLALVICKSYHDTCIVTSVFKNGFETMKKKVLFLLCDACICGGTYVILEHASRLQKMGYDVTIALVFMKMDVFAVFQHPPAYWHPALKTLRFIYIDDAKNEHFDVAIFTLWATLFFFQKINADNYFYFVQSIESRFFPKEETFIRTQVIKTYSLNLPVITEATWIQRFLTTHFHSQIELVRNGINKLLYTTEGEKIAEKSPHHLRILVEGPLNVTYKNVKRTLELCKEANVGEIWLLTSTYCDTYPLADRIFSKVPVDQVPSIYRSCDVLVKLSYVEGMFGPPLEMFHCGGTAIVYDVTGHDEYIIHNENALVVKTDDENSVVAYLRQLAKDRDLLEKLKKGALQTAKDWVNWDTASQHFGEALEKLIKPISSIEKNALMTAISQQLQENIPITLTINNETIESIFTINPSSTHVLHFLGTIPIFPGKTIIEFHFGKLYQSFLFTQLHFQALQDLYPKPNFQIKLNEIIERQNHVLECQSPDGSCIIHIESPETLDRNRPSFYLNIEMKPLTLSCALTEISGF